MGPLMFAALVRPTCLRNLLLLRRLFTGLRYRGRMGGSVGWSPLVPLELVLGQAELGGQDLSFVFFAVPDIFQFWIGF